MGKKEVNKASCKRNAKKEKLAAEPSLTSRIGTARHLHKKKKRLCRLVRNALQWTQKKKLNNTSADLRLLGSSPPTRDPRNFPSSSISQQ